MRKKERKKDKIVNAGGCESNHTRGDCDRH